MWFHSNLYIDTNYEFASPYCTVLYMHTCIMHRRLYICVFDLLYAFDFAFWRHLSLSCGRGTLLVHLPLLLRDRTSECGGTISFLCIRSVRWPIIGRGEK